MHHLPNYLIAELERWVMSEWSILCGAIGGFVHSILHDEILFPQFRGGKVFLGFVRPVLLGAFVGFLLDTHPVVSAVGGFVALDILRAIERHVRRRLHSENGTEQRKGG